MWTLAERHSLTPLLNSLFLEWKNFVVESPFITIKNGHQSLKIELKEFSHLGHHQYTGNIYLDQQQLSFKEFLNTLADFLQLPDKEAFIKRVLQSADCIKKSLDVNHKHLTNIKLLFKHTETALCIGHSLHPAPKSRHEFSTEDLLRYSPEHGGQFKLSWFLVHESIYFQEQSKHFKDNSWSERSSHFKKKGDFQLLPVHPWQKENILKIEMIKRYREQGLIIDLGEDDLLWTPTSSLRTIYHEASPYMLKFSMDLKMTNSIRHLLIHELQRGLQICDVSNHPELSSFFEEFKNFHIIQEPLYAGILDEWGNPLKETLIMVRDNPFDASDEVCLLATLTQPAIDKEEVLFQKILRKSGLTPLEWFELFLEKAIKPFLILQGQYGILLGAHQQNLILKLDEGKPLGVYFRDCHGTGYEVDKVDAFKKDIKTLEESNGNILKAPVSHYLFAYYLIINSVFNTLSALARCSQTTELSLLKVYRDFLLLQKNRVTLDSSFIDYLLQSQHLKHKGNFFCTVRNINENTSDNPLAIYTEITNPLWELT